MIYITGDTHGRIERFLPSDYGFIRDEEWTEEDTLLICGDFGFIFYCDAEQELYLDFLAKKPYTICFVDGNHECFDRIYEYPEQEWKGGKVHRIRDNIFHLMRGQIFEIEGKSFFTMGGGYSMDRARRIEGVSYWRQELPGKEEYLSASKKLEEYGYNVDYIVTHTAPTELVRLLGYSPDLHEIELTGFLEFIMYKCKDNMKCWFFGHFHEDKQLLGGKFRALLDDVVRII